MNSYFCAICMNFKRCSNSLTEGQPVQKYGIEMWWSREENKSRKVPKKFVCSNMNFKWFAAQKYVWEKEQSIVFVTYLTDLVFGWLEYKRNTHHT